MPKVKQRSATNGVAGINKITDGLLHLAVDASKLRLDPKNAKLHPEASINAIKQSLSEFGQTKPIVVRRDTMTVVAGNGTLEAARVLGWTKIAANMVDMDDVAAASYGLADNRVAEFSEWDAATVLALETLISDAGGTMIGWTDEDLDKLRKAIPAPPSGGFPEVDETLETDHVCPKCGYRFSGGETVERNGDARD